MSTILEHESTRKQLNLYQSHLICWLISIHGQQKATNKIDIIHVLSIKKCEKDARCLGYRGTFGVNDLCVDWLVEGHA